MGTWDPLCSGVGWKVLCRSVRFIWFYSHLLSLIHLSRYSVNYWKWGINIYYYSSLLLPSYCQFAYIYVSVLNIQFRCWVHMFIIGISSWRIDPFIIYNILLCLLWFCYLKTKYSLPHSLLFTSCLGYLFSSCHFQPMSLNLKWTHCR